MRVLMFTIFLLSFTACSAHSPMILKTTTDFVSSDVDSQDSVRKSSTPVNAVVVSDQTFSSNKVTIGKIDVGTIWYGSCTKAYKQMAAKASEVGANAVEDARCWKQPSGFSWASPHASGQAVLVRNSSEFSSVTNLQNAEQQ